jgi:transglutaminase-like putative cysteine protease
VNQLRSTPLLVLAFLVLALGFLAKANAEPVVDVIPLPSWVSPQSVPAFADENIKKQKDGVAWLLSDEQVIRTARGQTFFVHFANKVIDRAGLEFGSNTAISINPVREKLKLVRISVSRNGTAIDHTADSRIDPFRREDRQNEGILSGELTYSILVPDVRVGDIVDVAYIIESEDLVAGITFDHQFNMNFSIPVQKVFRKITWPKNEPLDVRSFETAPKPEIRETESERVYTWDISNPTPYTSVSDLPAELFGRGVVIVSSAKSWRQFVQPFLPYYRTNLPLPDSLKARLDQIKGKYSAPSDRLTEALRLVQDEIRYVSLSIGRGAVLPRSPIEVVASGFGDCKDKSLLLATSLRHLGIEADVALTDLDRGALIKNLPPSLLAFDHAIVRAQIEGKAIWLDATDYSQGGRGLEIEQARYGFAMPLVADAESIISLPESPGIATLRVTEETYELPKGEKGEMLINVTTTYRSTDADWYRKQLATRSPTDLAKRYEEYYSEKFDGLQAVKDFKVTDDRDLNVVITEESYRVPEFNRKDGETIRNFSIEGVLDITRAPNIEPGNRTQVADIGKAYRTKHIARIKNLTSDYNAPIVPEDISPWFDLSVKSHNSNGTFLLTWEFTSNGGFVLPWQVSRYSSARSNLLDATDRLYDFSDPVPETSPGKMVDLWFIKIPGPVMGGIVVAMLLLGGLANRKRSVPRYTGNALQPVSLIKFMAMSLLTFGLYNVYWAWMGYREYQFGKKTFALPLLQGVVHQTLAFNMLNIVTGGNFSDLRLRLKLLLLVCCSLYFASGVYDFYQTFAPDVGEIEWLRNKYWLPAVQAISPLPMVWLVNRANSAALSQDKSYRRFSRYDILSIICFGSAVVAHLRTD